jgi:hypothetical protein
VSKNLQARRQLLRSTAAWIAGAAAFAAARPGRAWRVESLNPESPLSLAYAKRCSLSSDHSDLVAQLKAQLANDRAAGSLTAVCPLCGCRVTADR